MWENVSTFVADLLLDGATMFESKLPPHRQRQLTLSVVAVLLSITILLLGIITWADIFYS
ncbi:MAG: hypothetical protein P4L81_05240 [Candidatus Pacebacteria bacterium]|nr:hypothetical protein [Candidatus Paceibacterota bacterium]